MHVRWLRSVTRITYLSKLIGTPSLAAFLKFELFRAYTFFNKNESSILMKNQGECGQKISSIQG
ncbi:hypothetical protein CVS35_20235 [Pectobacterium atrosepticum]|nr:hypothetical protein CVS35_20235 [Pectobacterium atrosepticum]